MTPPLVSLCVPTRNRATSLARGLVSTCGQDYESLEILISDNASDDDTERVCREAARQDARIRYVRHPRNIGSHGTHNFCIDESRGDYLCFFHDHDERDLSIVSRYVSFMQAHPDVGVVCSDWHLLDPEGRRIGVRDYRVSAVMPGVDFISHTFASGRSSIGIPGAMIRRSALGDIRFDEEAPIGFGDFIIWFQIAERHAIGHIHERLWGWTQEQRSDSARTIESLTEDYRENMTRYCDMHLARWPEHAALVERWRQSVPRYLFWALMFGVGLHFRRQEPAAGEESADRTLFEILDYRLTDQQLERVFDKLKTYRTGAFQHVAHAMVRALIHCGLTQPFTWAVGHQSSLRSLVLPRPAGTRRRMRVRPRGRDRLDGPAPGH